MRKTLTLGNRTGRPLPARIEHGHSYLMGGCEAMASERGRPPAARRWRQRKQASLGANDESARLPQLADVTVRGDASFWLSADTSDLAPVPDILGARWHVANRPEADPDAQSGRLLPEFSRRPVA
jgi:hypothetical protein